MRLSYRFFLMLVEILDERLVERLSGGYLREWVGGWVVVGHWMKG